MKNQKREKNGNILVNRRRSSKRYERVRRRSSARQRATRAAPPSPSANRAPRSPATLALNRPACDPTPPAARAGITRWHTDVTRCRARFSSVRHLQPPSPTTRQRQAARSQATEATPPARTSCASRRIPTEAPPPLRSHAASCSSSGLIEKGRDVGLPASRAGATVSTQLAPKQ